MSLDPGFRAWPQRWIVVAGAWVVLGGCSSLRYAVHVAHGQFDLLASRRPITAIIADPHTDPGLRERLREAEAARAFASDRLDLPRNRSYTRYVELHRPYVTWSVFATPEFSVDPLTHCFPFAGCVAYLGFFDRAHAEREAARLAKRGDDTAIEGVAAYSTLGWFADPILSSMLRWSDAELDGVIFHELAHQKLYVKDDSAFNESYATFVQEQGLREWRAARVAVGSDAPARTRDAPFTRLVLDLRERLRVLYASGQPAARLRAAKQEQFAAFRERYAALRASGSAGGAGEDAWVAAPLNNAKLVPFGLYDRWVDAFAQLFRMAGGNWPDFHARVARLARLPRAPREKQLAELAAQAAAERSAATPR